MKRWNAETPWIKRFRKKMEERPALGRALGTTVFMLAITGFWSVSFFAVAFVRKNITASVQHPLWEGFGSYLWSIIGGFVLMGVTAFLIVPREARQKQMEILANLVESMKRIAKGDYRVEVREEDRKYMGPFGTLVDSLKDMASELDQMEKMRQEFVSNVSHEIQSPLTSIQGFARALQSGDLSAEDRKRYLNIIETESGRLSKISENLLKLTSLESNHHPFEPKRYRLDMQLKQVLLACEPQWREKGVEPEVSLTPLYISADEELLSQVWMNLIGNGVKFTPAGGELRITAEQEGAWVRVRIADTGIGMTLEEQAHIFERFYKADQSRNRERGGSGLGLSIVKRIAEMHGGSVTVESTPGEGSVFQVTLPVGV
ncbi:sensor histidine kinase [Paenibacillus gansuensis]|uniref:histidine kinase n=1 Tax=Paenibacillus gansuensis TaxID=306542 RepID=A0ABW5PJJ3_9BACL